MDSNSSRPRTSRIGGLEQLGKYELVCVLARSDLGSLWASVITYGDGIGQLVAVQRIVVRPGDEETIIEPVRNAVEAVKGVRRPGVIPVLDCVVSPGRIGVVSEYVEGEPLRSLQNLATLKRMPISTNVAVRLVLDVLEGLMAFHGFAAEDEALGKYVYGGLTPDSIVVSAKGQALLLHPSLAAVAASLPALSWHTSALAYRAPEHLGSGTPIDARTDVFVAGAILWELIAQRQLFQVKAAGTRPSEPPRSSKRGDQVAIAQQVLTAPIDRLDSLDLPSPVPKGLADVVDKALQRDPAARFGSVREMAQALSEAAGAAIASADEVAQIVETLAASTLSTRRSAIARAGVEVAPGARAARAPAGDDDVFGSDWVVDADGEDEKIHALSAGALAMTPTPSAAIAVGPRAGAKGKPGAVAPKAASLARTPTPGVVRPSPKATPAPAPSTTATPPTPPVTPSPGKAAPPTSPPVPSQDPKDDDLGIDVDLPEDQEPLEARTESGHSEPQERVDAAVPQPPEPPPEASKPESVEGAQPPKLEVPPPPAVLVAEGNALMATLGDNVFGTPAADTFASSVEGDTSKPASPPAPVDESTRPAESQEPASPAPSPAPARLEAESSPETGFDEQRVMADRRRRKGYLAIGIIGGLAAVVGLIAIVRVATGRSTSSTAATIEPPASTSMPVPRETTPATVESIAAPAPEPTVTEPPAPTESSAPAPTRSVAVEPPPPKPPSTSVAAKPPPARTGGAKPKPAKPYVPSGI
jgi:serine/threonine protein kinase